MNSVALTVIQILHIIFVLFVIITPFTNDKQLLFTHAIFIPFLYLHWLTNDNTCALTMAERAIRRKMNGDVKDEDCFTCRLINPIFDFSKNYERFNTFTYVITFALWSITMYKIIRMWRSGEIKSWRDFVNPTPSSDLKTDSSK